MELGAKQKNTIAERGYKKREQLGIMRKNKRKTEVENVSVQIKIMICTRPVKGSK